jgi:hypothetical protein
MRKLETSKEVQPPLSNRLKILLQLDVQNFHRRNQPHFDYWTSLKTSWLVFRREGIDSKYIQQFA